MHKIVAKLVREAEVCLGIREGTAAFRQIIDAYNQVQPLPQGYRVKYSDDWCDVFITYLADRLSLSQLLGRECGVERHKAIFQQKGIWRAAAGFRPEVGDIIVFDWQANGWADHIGLVVGVSGQRVNTIEGNVGEQVARRSYSLGDQRIAGYARPAYASLGLGEAPSQGELQSADRDLARTWQLAKEVLAGRWGNGEARRLGLQAVGVDPNAVQAEVNRLLGREGPAGANELPEEGLAAGQVVLAPSDLQYQGQRFPADLLAELLSLAAHNDILPSFLIVMLHYEGLWGASEVARLNHNWAGMTWSETYRGHPEIAKTRGSARPQAEGGHYIRYQSVKAFLTDWLYLLRAGGNYRVVGQTAFASAVKGLFRAAGARYDYAAIGYGPYSQGILARYSGIKEQNPGRLQAIDQAWLAARKEVEAGPQKVRLQATATHWQTGEGIPAWVKERTFEVLETKEMTVQRQAQLLGNEGVAIGWAWTDDLLHLS